MSHVEGIFRGSSGETYWQAWLPEDPSAVVLLAHGLHEHSGRYEHVAARLTQASYAVYAVDHAGHGKSAGTKGNVGSFAGVLDDLGVLRRMAQDKHPGLPLVLLGHSLGGLIALDYLVSKGSDGVAALVLSGAAVDTSSAGGLQLRLAPLVGKVAPNLGVMTLGAEKVSRDAAVVADYEADPLNHHGKVRARTGAETLLSVQRVVGGLPRLTLPVLVLHGSSDALVPVAGSELIHARIGSSDKTLEIYDGLYHEIFNEPEQEQVLDNAVAWLDARV